MLKLFNKTCFNAQRGAMFGLDARLTLAILAGLSIVAGASMAQIMQDRRADNLLFEHSKVSSAVAAIQEDLETNVHDSLTSSDDTNAYLALVDGTLLTPAAERNWLGPYLREFYSNDHDSYGDIFLMRRQDAIASACTATVIRNRECFYYYVVSEVPITTVEDVNENLDGAEGTPQSTGAVQWDTITANDARLYMRLGLVAP